MLSDSTRVQLLWALADRRAVGQRTRRAGGQAGAVGVATPGQAADGAARAHPAGGHPGVLPAGERTRPPARHRRGVQRRARRRWRARAPPRRRASCGRCTRRRRADGLSTSSWLGHGHHSHDHAHSADDARATAPQASGPSRSAWSCRASPLWRSSPIVAASGSVGLFADTVHNFSDALTAVPLWIAFAMSRRAATRRYTYGFGRVEDLAGLFVVAMIAIPEGFVQLTNKSNDLNETG